MDTHVNKCYLGSANEFVSFPTIFSKKSHSMSQKGKIINLILINFRKLHILKNRSSTVWLTGAVRAVRQQWCATYFYLRCTCGNSTLSPFLSFMNIKCSAVYKYYVAYFAVKDMGSSFLEWENLIILEMSWMKSKYAAKLIILLSVDVYI